MTTHLPHDQSARLERALLSLDGLSVGDAFGQRFFYTQSAVEALIAERAVPHADALNRTGTVGRQRIGVRRSPMASCPH